MFSFCWHLLNIKVALTFPLSGGGSCCGHLQEQFPVGHVPKNVYVKTGIDILCREIIDLLVLLLIVVSAVEKKKKNHF